MCFVEAKCLFLESSDLGCFLSYFWSILGAILGYLGAMLRLSWAISETPWAISGRSWGHFGPLLYPADLNQGFQKLVFRGCEMLVFGILLSWLCPELPWSFLEAIAGNLGLSCSHLGAILGYIGPILGLSWAFLEPSWPSLRGNFCVTQNLLWQILRNAKFAKANFA